MSVAAAPEPLVVREVVSKADMRRFIAVPMRLNADDPAWIAPLISERLAASTQLPILWFVKRDEENLAPQAIRGGVTSFVVDGLNASRIGPLITIAVERHKLVSTLQGELQKSKDNLAARKTVERAKGLLMQTRGMSEQEAYQSLRSTAMRQGKSLKSVCDAVISLSDLLP